MPKPKIKLERAKQLTDKITYLENELRETLRDADEVGLTFSQHVYKGTLERYSYILTVVTANLNDLE